MTKRKSPKPPRIPPDAKPEQAAEIWRQQTLVQTATLATAMLAVNKGNPARADLAAIAWHLNHNRPDLIPPGPMAPYIRAIIRMFEADNPLGRPKSAAVALAVDFSTAGRGGVSIEEAHRRVAEVTGKTPRDVKQARYRARTGKRQP
jgi:hypothetical protein